MSGVMAELRNVVQQNYREVEVLRVVDFFQERAKKKRSVDDAKQAGESWKLVLVIVLEDS